MIQQFHSWACILEKTEALLRKDTSYNVHSSTLYNSQVMEAV